MIDRETIARIMDAADIVDVVKDFVTLKKAGVNYKGLCPFHNEKTPSFVVSPAKQLCKCFSCGKGGNVVHFIMEHEQMTYPEALRFLAKRYNIEIKEKELTPEEKAAASERESLLILNEWARDYFSDILWNHADGRAIGMAYFRERGFRDDIIKKFQLGFCLPDKTSMGRTALAKGYRKDFLLKTGLCYETQDHQLIDRYHGRTIFPVHSVSGRVVAFGGRVLQTGPKIAKYVNSPESEIYHKSHELYGLFFAKHAIVKENRCFLVEGYTDVISMHQSGIENVVASSGTSLTEGQIRLLHRFTENITILYDGDNAGIKASLRGIDMLLAEGLNIKVLLLPDGDDPDSVARKHTAEEYRDYIDKHQVDFIKFKTNLLLQECENDPVKRASLIADIVKSIAVIPSPIVRQMYARECAVLMHIEESIIVNEIAKQKREIVNTAERKQEGENESSDTPTSTQPSDIILATANQSKILKEEKLIAQLIVKYGTKIAGVVEDENGQQHEISVAEYIQADLENDQIQLQTAIYKKILEEALVHAHDQEFDIQQYFLRHTDPQISMFAAETLESQYTLSKTQLENGYKSDEDKLYELVPHLLTDFKYAIITQQMKDILSKLQQPEITKNEKLCTDLMKQYMNLKNIERQMAQILGERVLSV